MLNKDEGTIVPSFCTTMELKQELSEQVNILLEEFDLYLIDIEINAGNEIEIHVDSDTGINIQECKMLSRKIESWIHEEKGEDAEFSLTVGSPGIDVPLKLQRQYLKNKGRKILVIDKSGEKSEGKMIEVDEEKITLEWKERVPKEIGKGKKTVTLTKDFMYNDIATAKVLITF